MNNFKYANLSDSENNFLLQYCPEDDFITSQKEVDLVIETLSLKSYVDMEELRAVRNSVVKFYSELEEKEIIRDENGKFVSRTEQFWKYSTAMQSVTAVIDHVMYTSFRTID